MREFLVHFWGYLMVVVKKKLWNCFRLIECKSRRDLGGGESMSVMNKRIKNKLEKIGE